MTNFEDVGDFHAKFGLPEVSMRRKSVHHPANPPGPRDVPAELLEFRLKFLQEELDEFIEGMGTDGNDLNHAKMADALVDLVYVAMGTAHLQGYPWEELWADVQAANMRKVRSSSTEATSERGGTWDVVKPPGWVGPDTEGILARHGFPPADHPVEDGWAHGTDHYTGDPLPDF